VAVMPDAGNLPSGSCQGESSRKCTRAAPAAGRNRSLTRPRRASRLSNGSPSPSPRHLSRDGLGRRVGRRPPCRTRRRAAARSRRRAAHPCRDHARGARLHHNDVVHPATAAPIVC